MDSDQETIETETVLEEASPITFQSLPPEDLTGIWEVLWEAVDKQVRTDIKKDGIRKEALQIIPDEEFGEDYFTDYAVYTVYNDVASFYDWYFNTDDDRIVWLGSKATENRSINDEPIKFNLSVPDSLLEIVRPVVEDNIEAMREADEIPSGQDTDSLDEVITSNMARYIYNWASWYYERWEEEQLDGYLESLSAYEDIYTEDDYGSYTEENSGEFSEDSSNITTMTLLDGVEDQEDYNLENENEGQEHFETISESSDSVDTDTESEKEGQEYFDTEAALARKQELAEKMEEVFGFWDAVKKIPGEISKTSGRIKRTQETIRRIDRSIERYLPGTQDEEKKERERKLAEKRAKSGSSKYLQQRGGEQGTVRKQQEKEEKAREKRVEEIEKKAKEGAKKAGEQDKAIAEADKKAKGVANNFEKLHPRDDDGKFTKKGTGKKRVSPILKGIKAIKPEVTLIGEGEKKARKKVVDIAIPKQLQKKTKPKSDSKDDEVW